MSTLTLPVRSTIAPSNPELIAFAEVVMAAKTAGLDLSQLFVATPVVEAPATMPATVSKPKTQRQSKPAPKTRRKAADKKAEPKLVATKNGGMMDSTPGSVTKGQISKLEALISKHNLEPFTAEEMAEIRRMSMAQASDYRFDLIADLNA